VQKELSQVTQWLQPLKILATTLGMSGKPSKLRPSELAKHEFDTNLASGVKIIMGGDRWKNIAVETAFNQVLSQQQPVAFLLVFFLGNTFFMTGAGIVAGGVVAGAAGAWSATNEPA
jgi:hypothetical protein